MRRTLCAYYCAQKRDSGARWPGAHQINQRKEVAVCNNGAVASQVCAADFQQVAAHAQLLFKPLLDEVVRVPAHTLHDAIARLNAGRPEAICAALSGSQHQTTPSRVGSVTLHEAPKLSREAPGRQGRAESFCGTPPQRRLGAAVRRRGI